MTTPKPPVPSDLQYIYDHAEGGHDEGMTALWLAGYHARDARIAELADIACDREKTIVAVTAHNARLRERIAQLEALEKAPRRTPELKERVAQWSYERLSSPDSGPWVLLHQNSKEWWQVFASGVLDLVFGKERE